MPHSCPLCEKLARIDELPGDQVVWQFPRSVAFLGPWQFFTGYCVLVSRVHYQELHHMPAPDRATFLDEMITLATAIDQAFQPRKMNCESLGNQVPHVHWHLLPRSADDPDTLKPAWIALDRAERDEAEKKRLEQGRLGSSEIVARLRSALTQLQAPTA